MYTGNKGDGIYSITPSPKSEGSVRKKALGYLVILPISALFFFPSLSYSLYTGKDTLLPAGLESSPTRLIVKLRPDADKKVTFPTARIE